MLFPLLLLASSPGRLLRSRDAAPGMQSYATGSSWIRWLGMMVFFAGGMAASAQSTSVLEWNFGTSSYSAAANVKHAAVGTSTVTLAAQGATASSSGTYYMSGGSWVNAATAMNTGRSNLSPLSGAKEFYTTFTLGNTVAGDWSSIAVQLDYLRTSTSPTKIQASLTWLEGSTYRTKYSSALTLSGTSWTTLNIPLTSFYPSSNTAAPPLSGTTFLLEIQAYTVSTTPNTLGIDNVKLLVNSLSNTTYGDYSGFGTASSTANSNLRLGAIVTAKVTGTADALASLNTDDDGVDVPDAITQGVPAMIKSTVTNTTGASAYLNIWIDYNKNGSADTGEQIVANQVVTTGTSGGVIYTNFTPPAAATAGMTGVRARLTSTSSPGLTGASGTGEVEDYVVDIIPSTCRSPLGNYNVIARNNLSTSADIEGAIMTNNYTSGNSVTLVKNLAGTPTSTQTIQVQGTVSSGSSLSLQYGSFYAPSTAAMNGRSVNYNGGGSLQTTPAPDFTGVFDYMISSSGSYASLAANGTVTIPSSPSAATLTVGTLDAYNVAIFNVDGNSLLNNSNVQQIDLNLNGTTPDAILINVTGTSISYSSSGNFVGNMTSATWRPKILWNFYQATSLAFGKAFNGSVLAPFATLTASAGAIEGSVAVNSLSSTVEVHLPTFLGGICPPTLDYGDSSLITTNASSTVNSRLMLGATVDAEATATTNATATGDDITGIDDDDGVIVPTVLYTGTTGSITVTATNTTGSAAYLNAWIDFNRNGLLTDSGEQIATNTSVPTGTSDGVYTLNFTTPAGASIGNATVRVRLTSTSSPGPTGTSGNGEVEDYITSLQAQNVLTVGNLVWNDANDNGVADSGESGISGIKVELMDPGDDNAIGGTGANADTVVATTTTNATGTYSFTNQYPGTYYLRVTPTATYPVPTYLFAGDTAIDNKNKGTQPAGALTPIYGPIFSLAINGEPGAYGTTNVENTMDFGLHVDGTCPTGNQLTNNSFETGTFTSDGTLAGSPRRSSASSMPTGWTDYQPPSYWIDATAAGGSIDGNKLLFQPGTTVEPCFSPGTFSGLSPTGDYQLTFWAAAFDPANPTASVATAYLEFDGPTTTQAPITVVSLSPGGSVLSTLPTTYCQWSLKTSNPRTTTGVLYTGAAGQVLDWRSLNWQKLEVRFKPRFGYLRLWMSQPPSVSKGVAWDGAEMRCGPSIINNLGIGNLVFTDTNSNGKLDGTETGLDGVNVSLFNQGDNPLSAHARLMTTTYNGGRYLFSGLPAGNYFVHVPPSEFASGRPLYGKFSSPGAGATGAADDDVDENGVDNATPTVNGISTATITLTAGGEPLSTGVETGTDDGVDDGIDGNFDLTEDLGFYTPSMTIGNLVWNDSNDNGVIDAGESGIDNVLVELWTPGADNAIGGSGANADVKVASKTTAGGGLYSFTNLAPGSYYVKIPTPPLARVSSVIDPGDNGQDNDNNGTQPGGSGTSAYGPVMTLSPNTEPGTSGTTNIDNTMDFGFVSNIGSPFVCDNRFYIIQNLESPVGSGDYDATLYYITAGPTLTPAFVFSGKRLNGLAAYGGYIYCVDQVGNHLYRINSMGLLVDMGAIPGLAAPPSGGQWSGATALTNGRMILNQLVPGSPNSTALYTIDLASASLVGSPVTCTNAANNAVITANFGDIAWDPLTNKVYGYATNDTSQQGLWEINLTTGKCTQIKVGSVPTFGSLVIDANGLAYGYGSTEAAGGVQDTLYVFNRTNGILDGTLTAVGSGMSVSSSDGAACPGAAPSMKIGNLVWYDANNNGVKDSGETGIAGLTLQLFLGGQNPATATPAASTTTDANGAYSFSNLSPGQYFVYIPSPPAAYPKSSGTPVTLDNSVDNDNNGIQSASGQPVSSPLIALGGGTESITDGDTDANSDLTVDFGFAANLSIGNLVWNDTNNNGLKDAAETGIGGVSVQLFNPGADNLVNTADDVQVGSNVTTSVTGAYLFTGLSPGKYFVKVTPPTAYPLTSGTPVTTDNGVDNNNDGSQPGGASTPLFSPIITLTAGGEPVNDGDTDANTNLSIDFGLFTGFTVGNLVWNDTNNNGVVDSGETGISGVTVERLNSAGVSYSPAITTTTNASGAYSFLVNTPGTYKVKVYPSGSYPLASSVVGADDATDNKNDGTQSGGAGTPSTSFAFTLTAGAEPGTTGTTNVENTIDFGFRACPTITVTPASISVGAVGIAYSQTLVATGGIGPYVWTVTSGTLPSGLTLNSAGVISGTPTSTISQTFTVQAADTTGCAGVKSYTLAPTCPAITITPSSAPPGTVGTAYSQTMTATGGNAPYTWVLQSGTLPAGLTFTSGGVLSGNPTTSNGAGTSLTFRATDNNGCIGSINWTLKICPVITVSPTTLTNGTVGTAYSTTFTATGSATAYSYSVISGTLPAGLSLSSAGVLSGTPTSNATQTFTVQATDANGCPGTRGYTMTPVCPTLALTPASIPTGTVGTAYSQSLLAANGVSPYAWTLQSGTLPAGLSLTSAGVISGSPTTTNGTGTALTFRATDTNGCLGTIGYTLKVCPVITVTPASLADGTVGTVYSQTVTSSGGATPYAYSVSSGTLPAGLSISSSTGAITGTPTTANGAGTAITVTATDANGCTGLLNYTLQICPVITVSPTTLAAATVGTAYSQTLTATGGATSYTWSVISGTLPAGLSLSAGGVISGTPTNTTSQTFTVQASDVNGCPGTRSYTLAPVCPAVSITPASVANGTLGIAYSQPLAASGGTSPYAWAVTSGSLPGGLSLNTGTGLLSGTPTASNGAGASITVRATDTYGCLNTIGYTLKVCPVISLTPASLPASTVGTAYNASVAASGGAVPYAYAVSSGTLPTGLSLNTSTGAITGTPSTSGSQTFAIRATDTNGCATTINYTLAPACPTISLTPASMSVATAGTAYSQTLAASGGNSPYTWTLQSGTLPAGLSLTTAGVVSGTPSASNGAGTSLTFKATDTTGCSATIAYTFKVCPVITITPASLAAATVGTAYSQTLTATGGATSYTWSVISGSLPGGLSLSSGGVISGTPNTATSANFTVQATDVNGCPGTMAYVLASSCPVITINPASVPTGTTGTAYSQTLTATGGTAPYSWSVTSGTLPAGLSLSSSGVISGTPTTANGTGVSVTVQAKDSFNCPATKAYTLKICPVLAFTPSTLPAAVVGTAYSATIAASNGAAPYSYAVTSGVLPAGLSLNASTGVLSGTPTSSTGQTFTVQATDASGCPGTITYTITPACPAIAISPGALSAGTVGTVYSQTLTASGGTAAYVWTVQSGTLPAGLTLSSAGVLSGTPTTANGTGASLVLRATDANGCSGSTSFNLKICPVISVSPSSLANGTLTLAYSQTIVGSGGVAPYSYTVSSGTLPAGLSLTSSTGVISGTPTASNGTGTSITVTAFDANSCPGLKTYNLKICPQLTFSPATLAATTVGSAYSQTITASNGAAPYTYSVTSGTLPAGLSLSSAGVLSGTPTSTTSQTFTVQAVDANGCPGTKSYTVAPVCPTIAIAPSSLPSATVSTAFSQTLTAASGTGPYNWTLQSGTLPAGLTFTASTGVLSGTPTTSNGIGVGLTFKATDSLGCTATIGYTMKVCPVITITPASLPAGTVGTGYSQTLSASGGAAAYAWSVSAGSLPPGLALSAAGVISGSPTAAGSSSFTVQAVDANGCPGTKAYTITASCPTLSVSPASLPSGTVGTAYAQTWTASGGTAPYVWALSSGALPAGLSLSTGGSITGIPTTSNGAGITFTVTASDANNCVVSKTCSNFKICPVITVSPASLPAPVVGSAYSQTISASGGATSYVYSVSSGALPSWATLNTSTGVISGTPANTTSATFTITATDVNGCPGSQSFTLTPVCPTIALSPTSLANGTLGLSYNASVTASGGTAAYTYAITSGTLPTGLSFSTSTGAITGTPTAATSGTTGTSLTIRAVDSKGCQGLATVTLKICPVITVNPATLTAAVTGTAYSQTFSGSGGTAPYSFAVTSGTLPTWASLNSTTGVLSGTPNSTTSATFTISATDANLCSGTRSYTVAPTCPAITLAPSTLTAGTVGTAYSGTVTASGGMAPYAYAITSGTLPSGLSFSTASGQISGTPTAATSGTSGTSLTIRATDAANCQGSQVVQLKICPVITLSPASLAAGTVGTAYSQTITGSGGTAPYTYAITSGTLPAGLSMTTAGVISGTPTTAVSANITITATDANACPGSVAYTLAVSCPVITITPATLAPGTSGTVYSQTLTATGGSTPYTWALTSGTLPAGLSMTTAGVISGTPSASNGAGTPITIQASDKYGCPATATYTFKICPVLAFTPSSLANGTLGLAYTQTIAASNGATPYAYSVSAGTLPGGLTLNGSTGVISGTPTASNGAGTNITVQAVDANTCPGTKAYTLKICPIISLSPSTLAASTVGTAYSQAIVASGGATPYTYAVTSGSLPAWASLNATTGVISGMPNNVTSVTFSITATDVNGCPGTLSYTIAPSCPTLTLTPAVLNPGTAGTAYSQTLSATGGTSPYSWAVTSGVLPAGLSMTSAGVISGTPTASNGAGVSITVKAADNLGCVATKVYNFKICPVITVAPTTLAATTVGTPYSQTISATGGAAPYSFSVTSGALPTWAILNPSTGVLSGTPNSTTSASFTVTATDVNSCPGSRSYTLAPVCPAISVSPGSLSLATVGSVYNATFSASGGTSPYTFAVTSANLPAGLALTASTGAISGTPTTPTSGSNGVALNITATDSLGCVGTLTVNLKVCPVITVNPSSLPAGSVGTAYSQTITATGSSATPLSYTVTAGTLPAGLSLNSTTGVISGTPSTAVSANVTVTATDANGCSGLRAYTLATSCPVITITPATLNAATAGTAFSQTLSASGGTAPYNWTLISGALPAGMSLSSAGVISGTPSASNGAGVSITVQALDSFGCPATKVYPFKVCPVITVTPASLPTGTVGTAYSQTIVATGSTATPLNFAVTSGTLPAGLSLNSSTGALTGTPTVSNGPGTSIIITATDANSCTGAATYNLKICPVLTFTPASLVNGTVGTAYSQTITASGGASPYTYAITSGTLPAGLTFNTGTGLIGGTPTVSNGAGTSLTFTATDANGCPGVVTYLLKICPVINVAPSSLTNGTLGLAYTQTVVATGGAAPYNYAVTSGTLPGGLSIDSNTGVISGTPSVSNGPGAGITVTATDVNNCPGIKPYTLKICPVITVNPASLPTSSVGTAYSQTITATGGATPYAFSITSGALPSWATLNATTGVISGTPNNTASATFTVTASDVNGCPGTRSYTLGSACPTITVTPSSLNIGTVGTAYSSTVSASGGTAPYTYAVTSGTLPAGLGLNSSTGVVSGTPTAATSGANGTSITVTATDSLGCSGALVITVKVCPVITITPASMGSGIVGTAYNQTLTASGGTAAYAWSITSGSLPTGLSLSAAGVISGTPTAAVTSRAFTVQALDANGCPGTKAYTMSAFCPTVTVSPVSPLAMGTVGTAYTAALSASGGSSPYTFAVTSGTLPAGLSLSAGGVLSGTPTAPTSGTTGASFTVGVTDQNACPGSRAYTLKVCPVITVSGSPPAGTIGTAYSTTFTASGSTATSYTFSIISGALPGGLSLNTSTGVVSGTPTVTASANITMAATDTNGCAGNAIFTIAVGCPTITMTPASLSVGTVGTAYSQTFTASGGASPYVWTISAGTLPAGLSLATTGVLSGTPTTPTSGVNGTSITLQATDASGCALTKAYNFKICPVIAITPATLNTGTVGTAYNQGLSASGGATPYAWTLSSGTLPTGLSLNSGTGLISGTPTVSNGAGTAITVTATDVNVCPGVRSYNLKICPVISLSPSTMPAATVGTAYSQAVTASGGAAPYAYAVTSGALPAWASLNTSSGVISGTPNVTTSATFTITATDANGCPASLGYTIAPSCPVVAITPATLPDGMVNGSYSQTLTASGGIAPYAWTITTGSVPTGLSFNSTGVLSGTPTTVGTYTFTTRATDANGCAATRSYTVNVRSLRVGNLVWSDTNNNGIKDAGESGLSGITVELWSAGPNGIEENGAGDDVKVKADTVTNASGLYQFTDVPPGSGYYVRIPTPPATNAATGGTPVTLDNGVDNDNNGRQANPGDPLRSPLFALAGGAEPASGVDGDDTDGDLTIDFGLAPTVSVGNLVFKDINHNGAYDPGIDVVVDGVTLYLFASGADPLSATPVDATITAGGGLYLFSVRPGDYFVHIPPAMFAPGAPLDGTAPTLTASTNLDDNADQNLVPSTKPYAFGCNTNVFTLALGTEPTSTSGETGYQSASDDSYDASADLTVDLGLFPLPSPAGTTAPLAGRVRRDLTGTGDPSTTTTPLPGVEVALYADANANGQLDVNEMTAVATTTTDAKGAYVFEQVQAGDYLVVQSILPGAAATYDSDGGETDSTAITVTDAPVVDVDFLQSLSPDTFAQWQQQHAGSANGPTDNPDGDLYNNLLEYALGTDGSASGQPHFGLEAGAQQTVDAVLIRRSSGHNDLLYSLEGSSDLALWSPLNLTPTVTQNADGTETARYAGVTTPFVRLKVELDANRDGRPEAVATSPVSGWHRMEFAAASQTFSMPLLKPEVYAGKAGAARGGLFASGGQYYAEVISGELEGRRFEVNEAGSTAAAIAWESAPPPADARIAIRAHWTVGELFPATLFHAGTSAGNADRVMFFDGSGYQVIWLMARPHGAQWVRDGDATLADAGGRVVGPAEGVMVNPRQSPVSVTLIGEVRSWKFATTLHVGAQLVGAGFPVALSAAERGMDSTVGFVAAGDANSADRIQIWAGDAAPGSAAYTSYFYRQTGNLGSFWSSAEGQDATTARFFAAFRAAYLITGEAHSNWLQSVPWGR